jgi:hypothetical protein
MSALVGLIHGGVQSPVMLLAGAATGLAAYLALPSSKNAGIQKPIINS